MLIIIIKMVIKQNCLNKHRIVCESEATNILIINALKNHPRHFHEV